jgi:RHS repeat-associated protein
MSAMWLAKNGAVISTMWCSGSNEAKQFISQYEDPETNLSYLQARYYDGSKGEFLSEDPGKRKIFYPHRSGSEKEPRLISRRQTGGRNTKVHELPLFTPQQCRQ